MGLNTVIILAVAAYGTLMLGISLYWMFRVKEPVDFFMAQRGIGPVTMTGTVLATGVGTGVTLGASGLAYTSGWGGALYPIGLGLGILLVGKMFAQMREYNFMTLSEEIACYYGGNAAIYNFANVMLFLSKVFWLSVQILGGGFIISLIISGISVEYSIIIAGILIAVTTIPGGLLTVVYTDVVQVSILLVGFIAMVFVVLGDFGGLANLQAEVPPGYSTFLGVGELGWKTVVAIPVALILSQIADTNNRHRIYSATSKKAVRIGMYTAGTFEIIFSIVIGIGGMAAYALNPGLPVQDQAIPWLVMNAFPAWLAVIVVVAIVASTMSSGDSDAAVSATFFVRHIFPMATGRSAKNPLSVARYALVVIFILATLAALSAENIVDYVIDFLSIVLSGLAVVILLGRFWGRATWQGAVTAVILGAVVSLLVMMIPSQEEFWKRPIIPATLAALVGEVIVSLFTSPNKISFEEVAVIMEKERQEHGLEQAPIPTGEYIEEKAAAKKRML